MTKKEIAVRAVLVISLILFLGWGWLFWIKEPSASDNISVDLFSGVVLFLSFIVALATYQSNRKHDEYKIAEARREYFITNPELKKIRMLIEHNDVELQTMLAITNIMGFSKSGLLPEKIMELHEDFDTYLNYLEGIAILAKQRSIVKESLDGLWSYYFGRLRGTHLYDFDDPKHPILINDIHDCIDNIYIKNKNVADIIKTELKNYVASYEGKGKEYKRVKDANDPIEEKYEKDELRVTKINALARPIWYYINGPRYEFETVIELCVRLYEKKHVPLDEDGY
jgi:hypothetical protein